MNSKIPLVTVICICYNHSKYVEDALNSVINQTYKNIELIITDDYSTDNSQSIIEEWIKRNGNFRFIKNEKNIGNNKTFNKALKIAKGDYIIDLATDDILLKDCVETQINSFLNSKLKNLVIVYSNIDVVDKNKSYMFTYYPKFGSPESGDIFKMVIKNETKICSVGSMMKTEILKKNGGYDEQLSFEDFDIWVRLSRDYDFEYIPKILAIKRDITDSKTRQSESSKSDSFVNWHKSYFTTLEKAYKLCQKPDEYRALLGRLKPEQLTLLKTLLIKPFIKSVFLDIKIRVNYFKAKRLN